MRLKPLPQLSVAGTIAGKAVLACAYAAGVAACSFGMVPALAQAAESGTISVHAVVPENPIYDHAISKNSSVSHNAYAIDSGSDLVLTVVIRGPYDKPLARRGVCVFVVGPKATSGATMCGATGPSGELAVRPFTGRSPLRGEYAVVASVESGLGKVFVDEIVRFSLGDNPAGQEYPNTPSQAEHQTNKNVIQEQKFEQSEKWWAGLEFGTLNTVDHHIHAHTTITPKNAAMDPPARTRDGPFGDSSSPPGCGGRHQPPDQLPGQGCQR